jgi:hypothetical protein
LQVSYLCLGDLVLDGGMHRGSPLC